jgi:hypothetical protein
MPGEHSGGEISQLKPKKPTTLYKPPTYASQGAPFVDKTPARSVATSRTGTVSSTGGGTYGGYPTGGGGTGSYGAASLPAAPPMNINDWLNTDSTYQSQLSALKKALADYRAQQGQAQNQYNVDYTGRTRDLGQQKTRGLEDQGNDFASRGLYFSGVYGQDMNRLVSDYARRQSDMSTARSNYLANLNMDLSNFNDQQQLSTTKAKQDAVNRRAAQYGL